MDWVDEEKKQRDRGIKRPLLQSEHEEWNATHYPGTRQLCEECEEPTGRCEDDSLFADEDGHWPLCEECWEKLRQVRKDSVIFIRNKDHEISEDCWCHPSLVYEDPETGSQVWEHNYTSYNKPLHSDMLEKCRFYTKCRYRDLPDCTVIKCRHYEPPCR